MQSTRLDTTSRGRDLAVLFGDGAGVAILGATDEPERGILSTHLFADGSQAKLLWCDLGGTAHAPRITHELIDQGLHLRIMRGNDVYSHAARLMPEAVRIALEANDLALDDVRLLVAHQANLRILQMVQKRLGLREDQVFNNIQRYGNTTAATIPIALHEALEQGRPAGARRCAHPDRFRRRADLGFSGRSLVKGSRRILSSSKMRGKHPGKLDELVRKAIQHATNRSCEFGPIYVGKELGVSSWLTVDQSRIDQFAECSGDRQWIHVDVERAKRESPYRSPIAHGYLALSLVAPLQMEIGVLPEGAAAAFSVILIGLDRVRFLAPVKAVARVRLRAVLTEVEQRNRSAVLKTSNTLEIEARINPRSQLSLGPSSHVPRVFNQ